VGSSRGRKTVPKKRIREPDQELRLSAIETLKGQEMVKGRLIGRVGGRRGGRGGGIKDTSDERNYLLQLISGGEKREKLARKERSPKMAQLKKKK